MGPFVRPTIIQPLMDTHICLNSCLRPICLLQGVPGALQDRRQDPAPRLPPPAHGLREGASRGPPLHTAMHLALPWSCACWRIQRMDVVCRYDPMAQPSAGAAGREALALRALSQGCTRGTSPPALRLTVLQPNQSSAALQAKKVLTTNPEAPVNVECIMNDVDAHGMITVSRSTCSGVRRQPPGGLLAACCAWSAS